jgi:hypothetical protein
MPNTASRMDRASEISAPGFFLPRIAAMAEQANPEGCTSRFGWARRVSSGNVVRRAAQFGNAWRRGLRLPPISYQSAATGMAGSAMWFSFAAGDA